MLVESRNGPTIQRRGTTCPPGSVRFHLKGSDAEKTEEPQEYVVFPEEPSNICPKNGRNTSMRSKKRDKAFWRQQMTI
jgi:hypothetical protein